MSELLIKNGNCIIEAFRLKGLNDNLGDVFFVREIEGISVGHAYYVPDESRLDDKALNQADNGYSQHLPLRVKDVLEFGTRY